jgi:DNA excision repair protein ERCC-2
VALKHGVCPYYLGQEASRWSDLVVGDYNYYFDGSAMLHALTLVGELKVGVLVDEAHNLVERARSMYSADLSQAAVRSARTTAPADVRKALDKVNRAFTALRKEDPLDALPTAFVTALKNAGSALEAHFAEAPARGPDGPLQQLYFEILGFLRLAESFGPHSVIELADTTSAMGKPASTVRIQNLIPAPFLKPRFGVAHTATLFSATLSPPRYYEDMLGLPESTAWIDVESPFHPDQLKVQVVRSISTRYPDRQRSAEPIARLIADQYAAKPGNYLAFFSSFDYLALVAGAFQAAHPDVPAWTQSRGMDEGARTAFLERFQPGGAGVGFAVLGGSFGEGIDLRGDRLVGAFVATLGLPQVNPRNEQLKACLEGAFGAGYDYTYLYPGIQKVVQAAGRVIRTQEDEGIVVLIDDRFARPAVRELLPAWWNIERAPA